jgi:hypothetical protein
MVANLVQFASGQSRVGDDGPGVEPARREQQGGKCNTVLADDDHPVARPDPQRREDGGGLANTLLRLAIAPGITVLDQRDSVGSLGNLSCHYVMDAARQTDGNLVETDRL